MDGPKTKKEASRIAEKMLDDFSQCEIVCNRERFIPEQRVRSAIERIKKLWLEHSRDQSMFAHFEAFEMDLFKELGLTSPTTKKEN